MVSAAEFRKGVASTYILYIVICKFRYWQDPYLVILHSINKSIKIYFYYAVLLLIIVVCLQIKDYKELSLNVKKVAQQESEF